MRRLALRSALSSKVLEGRVVVLDSLEFEAPKTRQFADVLARLEITSSALVLLPGGNENVERSANNLSGVKTLQAGYLNVRDLLGYDYVILPLAALEVIESYLG
jgi:large subunit ribosomal protein L4